MTSEDISGPYKAVFLEGSVVPPLSGMHVLILWRPDAHKNLTLGSQSIKGCLFVS